MSNYGSRKGMMKMKQHLKTVENTGSTLFERDVNELLAEGYKVKTTNIRKLEAGTYNETSVYQAILVKDTDEGPLEPTEIEDVY